MQKEASDRPPVLLCGLASGSLILQLQLPQVMTALGCVERETGREGEEERKREGGRETEERDREREGGGGGLVFPTGMQTPQKRGATPPRSPPCRAEGLGEVGR